MTRDEWMATRCFLGADADPEALAHALRAQDLSVSVCLPALDVAETVGPIVAAIRREWVERVPLVDELIVVNGPSRDATAARAAEAGARVVSERSVLPEAGPGDGKGEALWKSLAATRGDMVLWLDSDVRDFDPAFVPGLLAPLVQEPAVGFVKAHYRRPLGDRSSGGGRVTEICARPLLNLFFPDLAVLAQPLSGEAGGRRWLLESVPFMSGYAVEIGLLIDILATAGLGALAQVDLGERRHGHQETVALGAMAFAIMQAVLRRAGATGDLPTERWGTYLRPVAGSEGLELRAREVTVRERPPMREMRAYRESPLRR